MTLPLGEWLDNLVYAYAVLSNVQSMTRRRMGLRDQIGRHARRVYGDRPAAPMISSKLGIFASLNHRWRSTPRLSADDAFIEYTLLSATLRRLVGALDGP